jgi:Helitron helicase-like domain at N-terminus
VVHVFHAKLRSLIKDISNGVLGDIAAYLYTIEFQKHSLPHAHIVIFLKPHAKLCTLQHIDSLMSSKFPDNNPELLELIQKFMVHGPCRNQNPNAPCIVNGNCSKGFPKPFREETTATEDSYACTWRSNTNRSYVVKGKEVNSQWVVCHSKYLIWCYCCHIDVEFIASIKPIKYIYKYVYKGHDHTTMQFGTCNNEIKLYLNAHYVSSCEAHWCLYFFDLQEQVPNVVHLPNQQGFIWDPEQQALVQDTVAIRDIPDTTLTGWFKANKELDDPNIHNLLYQDFPFKMV